MEQEAKKNYVEEWRLPETPRRRHLVGRISNAGQYWANPPLVRLDVAGKAFASDGRQNSLLLS